MTTGGAFLTSREIFSNPIWQNIVEFRLFILIYGNAVFAKEGVRIGEITLDRGQWLRSIRNLQKDLEYVENRAVKTYSTSTIKRAIDSLVKQKRIVVDHVELGTLFTVLNYEEYQGFERYSNGNLERRENSNETATKQQRNDNKKDIKEMNVEKEKTSRPKRVYDEDSPYIRMAKRFLERVMEWNPDYVFRGNMNTWADSFRLLVEKDKKSLDHIGEVINFVMNDNFLRTIMMSPASLRDKWNMATGKMVPKTQLQQPKDKGMTIEQVQELIKNEQARSPETADTH